MGRIVGIVANPASGRDIRRLVATASVFPTAEKANMVQRMLTALGAVGVDRVLLNTDLGGISAAVLRAVRTRDPARDPHWPEVDFLADDPVTGTADDTARAVRRMATAGAGAVVCLGGDGTARVAAAACGEVPLLPLSTGTNNAFPRMREATTAGLAAGLVAVGAVDPDTALRRSTRLTVTAAGRTETALVDVAVSAARHVGARALWDPATITELYCTFAEPDGIGLSSVAGQLCPSPRSDPHGVALLLGPPRECRHVVRAPIAPGLVVPVGVREWRPLLCGEAVAVRAEHGVIAVDGEREIELSGGPAPVVRLSGDGPRCVDITAVLAESARRGLLRSAAAPAEQSN
ncbi:putative polyphosphate/ATP-dependent NAD kinase [Murinocardiopsis flavida]|uniref:Putative polyphosphate/ATP-dependent NAD kinase n=1 Tax=Murinocardiopsis flavida TaxID=645275 RepID=A0A2P8DMQ6_9ACTN|nr:NAD(+)/NADH kinase [Murinocardiopsis flavida]PSK98488.1 putative polyphosphate/ATP-dependent NAD kinase [Murinocardiopsis flavida]